MKRTFVAAVILAVGGVGLFYWLTIPTTLRFADLPEHSPDLVNGERMFWAGGCASCHAAPDAEKEALLVLAGGIELATPFGVFRSPNISPDTSQGIGAWTLIEFVNAMLNGTSPDGEHYYPAFPYTYYQRMHVEDVIDLKSFLDTLALSSNRVASHTLTFPYTVRRGIGLWKAVYADNRDANLDLSISVQLGEYLVRGPGHCGACHTPRDQFGGEILSRFLAGAESLEATDDKPEWIPNITPHKDGLSGWSERDIAYALETGFDPEFDTFGSSMVEVQENMARLTATDRQAIAAYLKSIAPLADDGGRSKVPE